MNDSQQQEQQAKHANPPFLRSIILIILETFITFILKHDRMVRTHAKPFIQQHLSVQFNTFLPSDIFYITFTKKGVLFDHAEPQHPKPKMMIYASSIDLIKILFTGSEKSLQRLRLLGEEDLHEEFLMFLRSISLPTLFSDWKNWFTNKESEQPRAVPQRSIEPLLKRIEQQQLTINQLNIKVKEYEYDLKTLERKHKLLTRLYLFIIIALLVSFITFLWYNFV